MSCYAMMNALMAPDLTSNETRVWAYLLFRANGAKVCWPSVAEIADNLCLSVRRVMSATRTLQMTGRLKVTRRYKDTNNYCLLDVPGLHDRPKFHNGDPQPHVEMTKTAEIKYSPDIWDTVTCQNMQTDLPEPTAHPFQQESNNSEQQDTSLRSVGAREPEPVASDDLFGAAVSQQDADKGALVVVPAPKRTPHRIPDDWQPSSSDRQYALDHGVDPDRAAEEFSNYWSNRIGRGAVMISWSRAFQNRVLHLQDSGKFVPGRGSQQRSKYDTIRDKLKHPGFLTPGPMADDASAIGYQSIAVRL